jgi:hypothetical protein
MNKETLTLADAMQVARFGDEKYIEKLSQLIKDTKIMDNRFKSLSFSRGFAEGWGYQHRGDNAIILQKATVKQGTQGVYHDGDNDQMEFVLNNTTKQITFNDVVYDKAENVFRFNSTIQNV